MSSKAACTFVINMGPADFRHDLELLGLVVETNLRWRNQRIDSPIIKAKQNVLDNFHFSQVRDWLYEGKISSEYNKLIYSYYREIAINVRKVV